MQKKYIVTLLLSIGIFFSSIQITLAEPSQRVEVKFIHALMKNDEKLAKSFLAKGVKIPELRENTPIGGFDGLSSPNKGVMVLVAYYRELGLDGQPPSRDRIAFIWELVVENGAISNIKVVY